MRRPILALILIVGVGLSFARARADVGPLPDEWPVERNAQLLRDHEWKVGLFGLEVGVLRRLQLGTLWPTWAVLGPNVHVKGLLLDVRGWRLAVEASFFYVNFERLAWYGVNDVSGRLSVLPVELYLDKQVHRRLLLGVGSGYAMTSTSSAYDPREFSGAGAYDTWLAHGHASFRATAHLCLVLEVDWVLHQRAGALAAVDDYQVDAFTEVDGRLRVAGEPLRPGRGGALTLSAVVRARRFGLRFGLGYGHFAVPRVRLVVPVAIPFFTVDVYARFGGT